MSVGVVVSHGVPSSLLWFTACCRNLSALITILSSQPGTRFQPRQHIYFFFFMRCFSILPISFDYCICILTSTPYHSSRQHQAYAVPTTPLLLSSFAALECGLLHITVFVAVTSSARYTYNPRGGPCLVNSIYILVSTMQHSLPSAIIL